METWWKKLSKKDKMDQEANALAEWMIDNKCSIRALSKEFMMSKSTIHRRLSVTLKSVDYEKWKECQSIMNYNRAEALNRARRVLNEKRAQK